MARFKQIDFFLFVLKQLFTVFESVPFFSMSVCLKIIGILVPNIKHAGRLKTVLTV